MLAKKLKARTQPKNGLAAVLAGKPNLPRNAYAKRKMACVATLQDKTLSKRIDLCCPTVCVSGLANREPTSPTDETKHRNCP